MKVLQIIQKPQLRGAEIFACQLSAELQRKGVQTDVVYLFSHTSFDLAFDLKFIPLGAEKKKRFWDLAAYKKLDQIIRSEGYDVVQANAGDTLKYAVFSKVLYGWKQPLIFRNANKMSAFIRSKSQRVFNRFLLKKTRYIISVSENCMRDVQQVFGIRKNITAIPIGTYDFEEISPFLSPATGRVIINIGSFVPEKNHRFLVQVFAGLLRLFPEARLWLVGDGVLRKTLEEQCKQLGVAEKVVFWGYRKDPVSLLKAADVLVMPSLIEGLPGAILEAFACKVPVVASDAGGIPEVVEDGVTGVLIQGYDEKEYIKRISRILNKEPLVNDLIANAHLKVQNAFMMEPVSSRFLKIYNECIPNHTA
jgi:L-malate glycosyltransferase